MSARSYYWPVCVAVVLAAAAVSAGEDEVVLTFAPKDGSTYTQAVERVRKSGDGEPTRYTAVHRHSFARVGDRWRLTMAFVSSSTPGETQATTSVDFDAAAAVTATSGFGA